MSTVQIIIPIKINTPFTKTKIHGLRSHKIAEMAPPKPLPPISILHEYFNYDPDNGQLTWKVNRSKSKIGQVINNHNEKGYIRFRFNRENWRVHRVAWAMHHGEDPGNFQVDHINGQRDDNRITNLRLVTNSENNCNMKLTTKNKSGVRGVNWIKHCKKWRAEIKFRGKHYQRHYEDKTHAIAARCLAEYRLFGEHSPYFSRTPTSISIPVDSGTTSTTTTIK
jgi:HNH endonuclease